MCGKDSGNERFQRLSRDYNTAGSGEATDLISDRGLERKTSPFFCCILARNAKEEESWWTIAPPNGLQLVFDFVAGQIEKSCSFLLRVMGNRTASSCFIASRIGRGVCVSVRCDADAGILSAADCL